MADTRHKRALNADGSPKRQPPLGHNDARTVNRPTNLMAGTVVLDEHGNPVRPQPPGV